MRKSHDTKGFEGLPHVSGSGKTFFNNLLLNNLDGDYKHLWVAPNRYKRNIIQCIERERAKGENGRIIIKCNSLTERDIIVKLIEASQSGVKISIIIRGICCLVPGVPGCSENIEVVSIVGRFLEHSRIFCFGAGGDAGIYISSADLMTRNTERRIEVACPVLDAELKRRICAMLDTMLADNTKAWKHLPDGRYILCSPQTDAVVNSQEIFTEQARASAAQSAVSEQTAKTAGIIKRIAAWASKPRKDRLGS